MSSSSTITGDTVSSYLAHHGRKGQKWGQHIFGIDRTAGRPRSVSEMSDAELQRVVARKRLESQYKHYAIGRNSDGYSKFAGVAGAATSAANTIGSGLQLAGQLTKKKRMQDVGKLVGAVSKAASNGIAAIRKSDEIEQKRLRNSIDLSGMSDAELMKYVNRESLKQQYSALASEDVVTGEEIVSSLIGYIAPMNAVSKNIAAFQRGGKPDDDSSYSGEQQTKVSGGSANGNKPSNAATKKAK